MGAGLGEFMFDKEYFCWTEINIQNEEYSWKIQLLIKLFTNYYTINKVKCLACILYFLYPPFLFHSWPIPLSHPNKSLDLSAQAGLKRKNQGSIRWTWIIIGFLPIPMFFTSYSRKANWNAFAKRIRPIFAKPRRKLQQIRRLRWPKLHLGWIHARTSNDRHRHCCTGRAPKGVAGWP